MAAMITSSTDVTAFTAAVNAFITSVGNDLTEDLYEIEMLHQTEALGARLLVEVFYCTTGLPYNPEEWCKGIAGSRILVVLNENLPLGATTRGVWNLGTNALAVYQWSGPTAPTIALQTYTSLNFQSSYMQSYNSFDKYTKPTTYNWITDYKSGVQPAKYSTGITGQAFGYGYVEVPKSKGCTNKCSAFNFSEECNSPPSDVDYDCSNCGCDGGYIVQL
jgi:hypothetical protein